MTDAQDMLKQYARELAPFTDGAAMMIDDGPSSTLIERLVVLRVAPEYKAGEINGAAVWLLAMALGYENDAEAVRTIRTETWRTDGDRLIIANALGRTFTFTAPDDRGLGILSGAADTPELDAELIAQHTAAAEAWVAPEAVEDAEEDEDPALVSP